MTSRHRFGLLAAIAPGILVAATGVGAGDLATAAFTGNRLGTAVLWAVVLGAFLKFVLNEGLARWQLATGTTLLEGVAHRLGRPAIWLFLPYLLFWSFFVASALMSACGATLHAILPLDEDGTMDKVGYGMACGALGLVLVRAGGYPLFEKVMGLCTALMFVTVMVTAAALWPGWDEVVRGLFLPSKETVTGEGLTWTVALMGGVGGTVTVLAYGYWIREAGRSEKGDLALCRLDLGVGYAVTALFGMAMVIIGSSVTVEGSGVSLVVDIADRLEASLGPVGRWAFLLGTLGAVFSSLLGVWQSVPYLFADLMNQGRDRGSTDDIAGTRVYRWGLLALTFVPMAGLLVSFREVQKLYAVVGACFIPLLALALLLLNGRSAWVGRLRNGLFLTLVLVMTLLLSGGVLWMKVTG